jgi:hypothetical protein
LLLFGRIVEDLQIVAPADPRHGPFVGPRTGVNRFLEDQLTGPNASFARIYGFSYEGAYYELGMPTLFLVHGPGEDAETAPGAARVSRAPDDSDRSGLGAQDFSFADGLRVWSYDSGDFSIRLDMETGTFEQILLDIMGDDGGAAVSGARVSGARVSGARVSGARVSGARVSGARVRGARVKGARVGGDD